jgi:hypothetical protein
MSYHFDTPISREDPRMNVCDFYRALGRTALSGADGDSGWVETETGVKAFAGLAPDLFKGNAMALGEFRTALFEKERFDPAAFQKLNFFADRNVPAPALEAPTSLLGQGLVRGWATASLYGHAPETQVSRSAAANRAHLHVGPGHARRF